MKSRHTAHVALNVLGTVLPMLAGVLVVPGLLQMLGTERFGMLALAWVLVGYFGLLDMGLGRALTQFLAQKDAENLPRPLQADVARSARKAMGWIGAAWCLLIVVGAPLLAPYLKLSPALQAELGKASLLLGLAVPFLMWFTCCTGVLEARSRFAAVNAVRIPSGVASFAVPWAIAHYSVELPHLLAGLLAARVFSALVLAWISRNEFDAKPSTPMSAPASVHGLRQLLHFGGWLTVSNIVGPMLTYFDRMALAALVTMAAVAHYTIPFDVLSRLPAIPVAAFGVLFPLLSAAQKNDATSTTTLSRLVWSVNRLLVACWLPGMALVALAGHWILGLWVGPEIALDSTGVWQCLAIGVAINGFAHVPYNLLQSAGKTDTIAKIHLAELLPYALFLWWALLQWGMLGAAIAWTLRVACDTALLALCAMRQFPSCRTPLRHTLAWATCSALVLWGIATMASHPSASGLIWPAQLSLAVPLAVLWCGYHVRLFLQHR
jgi:O-antigen/teichoic acid export membrane protein